MLLVAAGSARETSTAVASSASDLVFTFFRSFVVQVQPTTDWNRMRASSISTASSGNGSGSKQKQMAALQGRLRDLERNTAELQLAVQISAEQAAQVKQLGANYGAL